MSNSAIFTTTCLFLLMFFGNSKSSPKTSCLDGQLCFTHADPLLKLSWSSAMQFCKSIGGTLPYNHPSLRIGNIIRNLGLQKETLWLGANFTYDPNTWHWTDDTSFTGPIENRTIPGKTHAYIIRNGSDVKLVATSPDDYINFYGVCQYSYNWDLRPDLRCASNHQRSFWTRGKCYAICGGRMSWNAYRGSYGQPLAVIDNLSDFSGQWLQDLTKYWIGLRSSWWTWRDAVTGNSNEVTQIDNGRFTNLFNGTNAQCLASYEDNNGNTVWTNRDCESKLPFICQYTANATTSNPAVTTTINPTTRFPTSSRTTTTPVPSSSRTTTTAVPTSSRTTTTPVPTSSRTTTTPVPTSSRTTTTLEPTRSRTTTTLEPTSSQTTTIHVPTLLTDPTSSPSTITHEPTSSIEPTFTPTTSSEGDRIASYTPIATSISQQNSNCESKPTIFGLSMEFFVGLGGALFLALAIWQALVTAYACRKHRGTKISPE